MVDLCRLNVSLDCDLLASSLLYRKGTARAGLCR
jgi:hypothetical protein